MAKKMVFIPPWGPYMEVEDTGSEASAPAGFIGAPPQLQDEEPERQFSWVEGHGTGAAPNPAAYAPAPRRQTGYTSDSEEIAAMGGGGGGGTGMQGSSYSAGGGLPVGGGGARGGGAPRGGGGMAMFTQYSHLDPTVWGKQVDAGSFQGAAGSAGQFATQLGGISPQVSAMPRTLYDQYSTMLTDPNAFLNNPIVKAALERAQQATGRQLAAQRISKSGGAAAAIAEQTAQTLMGQYGQMAGVLGQGAALEGSRWGAEQGMNLDATKARIAALQAGGNLALGAGELMGKGAGLGLEEKKLELARVTSGIQSPMEEYKAAAARAANPWQPYSTAQGVGYGGAAPSYLSQQSWLSSNWGAPSAAPMTMDQWRATQTRGW